MIDVSLKSRPSPLLRSRQNRSIASRDHSTRSESFVTVPKPRFIFHPQKKKEKRKRLFLELFNSVVSIRYFVRNNFHSRGANENQRNVVEIARSNFARLLAGATLWGSHPRGKELLRGCSYFFPTPPHSRKENAAFLPRKRERAANSAIAYNSPVRCNPDGLSNARIPQCITFNTPFFQNCPPFLA